MSSFDNGLVCSACSLVLGAFIGVCSSMPKHYDTGPMTGTVDTFAARCERQVPSELNNERLTAAIAVPKQYEFKLEDGRILKMDAWNPVIEAGCIVRVKASFIVCGEDGMAIPVLERENE